MSKEEILKLLTTIRNNLTIEKVTLPSLQKEDVDKEYIGKYIEVMTSCYEKNINLLSDAINKLKD